MLSRAGSLSIAILLQPLINTITGLGIRYQLAMVVGPLFYFLLTIYFLGLSLRQGKVSSLLVISSAFFIYAFHVAEGMSELGDFSSYLKVVFPFFVFSYFKNAVFDRAGWIALIKNIERSIIVYCALVIFSFVVGYQIQEGKGYFGFIYAGNELIALFILMIAFSFYVRSMGFRFGQFFIVIAHLLTLSKSVLVIFPVLAVSSMLRNGWRGYFVGILLVGAAYILFLVYLLPSLSVFFSSASGVADVLELYELDFVLRIITFGRSDYLYLAIDNGAFDSGRWLIGNGVLGAEDFTFGKGGIEMDFFDAINYYGIIGAMFLLLFYYIPVFAATSANKITKLSFFVLVSYSFFGGHFFNNPLVGFYYGVFLGLLFNKSLVGIARARSK